VDTILEQLQGLGTPTLVIGGIVVVVVALALIRKLVTLFFVLLAIGFGGWAGARQMGWDIPFVLPAPIVEAARNAAETAAAGYSSGAASRLDGGLAQPESVARSMAAPATPPAAQAAAEDLARAEIRYNAPDSMQLNMPIDMRLVVDASGLAAPEILLDGLPGEVREGQAELTRQVTATLTGSGFDIRPLKPARQVLPEDRASTWQWEVTPREEGRKTLLLEVFAHPGGSDAAASVAEFRDEIDVQVTTLSKVLDFVQTAQPAIGFAAGGLSLILAGMSFFRRRHRAA
jgi:hypothetical protein